MSKKKKTPKGPILFKPLSGARLVRALQATTLALLAACGAARPCLALNTQTPDYPMAGTSWLPWGGLIFGFFVAHACFVRCRAGRSRRQAEELTRSKERLEQEIADHQQVERVLREHEETFRQLTDNIRQVFWTGSTDLSEIFYISPAYEEIWGRPCESLYQNPLSWLESVVAEDRERVRAELDVAGKVLENESTIKFSEYRIERPDGTISWISDRAFAVRDRNGKICRLVGIAEDITERKKNEGKLTHYHERLEQMVGERTQALEGALQVAESANRAKSDFLAIMSHELRTPLTAILGFSEILLRQAKNSSGDKQKEYLDHIHASGHRLLALIDDILDLNAIGGGKVALVYAPVDIKTLIERIADLYKAKMLQHDIGLIVDIDDGIGTAQTDERQIKKILGNLLGNAVKFSSEGSKVTVTAQRAEETEAFEIAVADTGIGISPEHLGHIFEPFSQVDPSFTRRYGGLGLGLASTKHLVELLGGDIWVESAPGAGSTFRIALPLNKPATPPPPSPAGASRRKSRGRVLLVEDNEVNLQLALAMLEALGYRVDTARNGRQAVAAHALGGFDLVLMDCQMPEVDGFEATRLIRSKEATVKGTPHIPIIALTAHCLEGDRDSCLAAGMDDYLGKPFNQERMRAVLERWLPPLPLREGVATTDRAGTAPREPEPLPAPASTPIDEKILNRIRALQDPENPTLLKKVIAIYFQETPKLLQLLHEAAGKGDAQALRHAAHTLKSSSANLGAGRLALLCKGLEELARSGQTENIRTPLHDIEAEYLKVQSALETEQS
jgi:PAS domain S-box-containing protein